ncbi:MAG: DUF1592 domain-containing protein [Kofleriaceae bacterium]
MARILDIAARVSAVFVFSACWGEIGDPGNTTGPCGDIPEPALKRLSHTEYRNTVRDLFPMITVPQVALAPDPTPHGFDNDREALYAAPLLVNQYNVAAGAIAVEVRRRKAMVLPCMATAGADCGHQFVEQLAPRAFRRPVTGEELALFTQMFDAYFAANNFDVALELTTQAILQSPQFLYRIETGTAENLTSQYDIANRLSYFLWSTMPDQALFDAAAANGLATDTDIAAQVDRMLADPRALDGFMNFTKQWLEDARLDRITKPGNQGWSEDVRAALHEESRRFLEEVAFRRGGTLSDLLTSNTAFIGPETATFYGLPAPADWTEMTLPADRKGFLMQAQWLASMSHPNHASPVQRGLFILRNFMCVELGSPPAGVNMSVPAPAPNMPTTNRQDYELVTSDALCQTCHEVINPIGFVFEHYDTFGRYQELDRNLPIDPSGKFGTSTFAGPHELLDYLVESEAVHKCVVGKYITYATGGTAAKKDACLVEDVQSDFTATGGSLTQMMKSIATHPRYLGTAAERKATTVGGAP